MRLVRPNAFSPTYRGRRPWRRREGVRARRRREDPRVRSGARARGRRCEERSHSCAGAFFRRRRNPMRRRMRFGIRHPSGRHDAPPCVPDLPGEEPPHRWAFASRLRESPSAALFCVKVTPHRCDVLRSVVMRRARPYIMRLVRPNTFSPAYCGWSNVMRLLIL